MLSTDRSIVIYLKLAEWADEFSADALGEMLLIISKCRWSIVILLNKNDQ